VLPGSPLLLAGKRVPTGSYLYHSLAAKVLVRIKYPDSPFIKLMHEQYLSFNDELSEAQRISSNSMVRGRTAWRLPCFSNSLLSPALAPQGYSGSHQNRAKVPCSPGAGETGQLLSLTQISVKSPCMASRPLSLKPRLAHHTLGDKVHSLSDIKWSSQMGKQPVWGSSLPKAKLTTNGRVRRTWVPDPNCGAIQHLQSLKEDM
jgi:hypothetical protein